MLKWIVGKSCMMHFSVCVLRRLSMRDYMYRLVLNVGILFTIVVCLSLSVHCKGFIAVLTVCMYVGYNWNHYLRLVSQPYFLRMHMKKLSMCMCKLRKIQLACNLCLFKEHYTYTEHTFRYHLTNEVNH